MDHLNIEHAIELYNSIKNKDLDVTTDLGQLYFAIIMLGDEVARLEATYEYGPGYQK
jgi:hypothetical protein